MLDKDIPEYLDTIKTIKDRTSVWRDRMESDYALFRGELFSMPKDEGKWDCVTTNRPTTEGNKIIDYLTYARRRLWIPITEEVKKERKSLSQTERLAIGVLGLADEMNELDPYGLPIQNVLCFYAVVRGMTITLAYLSEEDGKLKPTITAYDPLNSYWIGGYNGLSVFYSCVSMAKEEIEYTYPGVNSVEYDAEHRAEIYFACDRDQMGTFTKNEWLDEPKKHELGYIPVRIKACRSTPLIQSERFPDTIKDVGESYLANYRNLVPTLSRLLTYNLTRAGVLAKMPTFVGYDSTKGGKPPEFEGNPQAKGAVVPLDVGKGQGILPYSNMTGGVSISESLANVENMASMGGLAKVAYGTLDAALPAQGIDILSHSTMDVIKPFKQAVERDFIWQAEEIVKQYKNGDFEAVEIEGYDGANNRFHCEVKPKEIKTNWRFECELIPDLLRDEQMYMNMATQAVGSGLLSGGTARDKYRLVDDTDLEEEKISRERASKVAEVDLWEMAAAMKADGNEIGFRIVMNKLIQLAQGQMGTQQARTPMGANPPRQPGLQPGGQIRIPPMTGVTQPESTTPSVPQDVQQKARLARLGMVKG